MKTGRLYLQTFLELFIFIVIGFFFTQYVLRFAYERAGIAYNGNIGVVCLGAAFLLLCTYTILRIVIVKKTNATLSSAHALINVLARLYLWHLQRSFSICTRRHCITYLHIICSKTLIHFYDMRVFYVL